MCSVTLLQLFKHALQISNSKDKLSPVNAIPYGPCRADRSAKSLSSMPLNSMIFLSFWSMPKHLAVLPATSGLKIQTFLFVILIGSTLPWQAIHPSCEQITGSTSPFPNLSKHCTEQWIHFGHLQRWLKPDALRQAALPPVVCDVPDKAYITIVVATLTLGLATLPTVW